MFQYTHCEELAAARDPEFMFGGRKLSETCAPSKVQQIGEKSVRMLGENNTPINRAISRSRWGLGRGGGENQMFLHRLQSNVGQHTCFLSSEYAGALAFSSWKRNPKPIFMFRLKLMQGKLSDENFIARASGRISSYSSVCFFFCCFLRKCDRRAGWVDQWRDGQLAPRTSGLPRSVWQ